MPLLAAVTLAAHVGGIPTQALFDAPVGVGNVADQSYILRWQDNEMDETGRFDFYYQPTNVPPNASLMSGDLVGTPIPNGQQVVISDPQNDLVWDTSNVPAGSYYVYEITTDTDMGVPPIHSMSKGAVTVRHPGDPLYPAVIVDEPNGIGDVVADGYALRWTASGTAPLRADIYWKIPESDGPMQLLVADVPMHDLGNGLHAGCYVWNLSGKAQGYYFVRVDVKDAQGLSHSAYSRASLTVYRDPNPVDAGPVASCPDWTSADAGVGGPDGGPGIDNPDPPGPCDCRVGGRETPSPTAAALIAIGAALLALPRAGRRRSR